MGWLKNLLGLGRLRGEPRQHNAGRVLAPAPVQRTQLGLREVDLPRGVVRLRSGEVRCFLEVTGYAAHMRSPEEVRAWLQGYARVLNTLPGNAVLFLRSRPGGLGSHVERQRAQAAALAEAAPGGALARLAADQLAHARRLEQAGAVRQTEQYVALCSPKGNVERLLAAARACRERLGQARVMAELVTDRALADALAFAWHPGAMHEGASQSWTQEWPAADGRTAAILSYWPKRAAVLDPPAAPPAPVPRARVDEVRPGRKALPR
jgi:hypothetical protein